MDKKLINRVEVQSFLEAHELKKISRSRVKFNAVVKYQELNISERTEVLIDTKSDNTGYTTIIPTGEINENTLHVGFDPKWQTFKFDKNTEALIITGTAIPDKGGKPYTVKISFA